ncbi:VWA domain-containing protein [Hyphomonas sp. WL0036]|uniref:VWA domain-containing protein n=1 Tax=Hyphomonas sediminis TaxID=2866160 RepID=UPI001C7E26A4|nr:VWA domain-containing protein [Hyphomonas sediminis]MBY9067995.1 VWA domain-containing protein [Hyphomonas sediminis]
MKRFSQRPLQASAAALALAALAATGLSLSAQAREETPASPGQAILVLDASGSMWAEMKTPEGKKTTRIETARETISAMLDELPSDIELGLIAYGHRRKGDCKDIQTLIKPGKVDKAAFRSTVNKLNPKGMTPLTDAVKQAAEALRYTEQKATVILVTDGLETCAPDPCAAALALEEAGIDFTAHVIGFGLSREESEKVSCIAENTGGKYLEAKDAAGLSDALGEVVLEPAEPVEIAPPEEVGPWFEGQPVQLNVQLSPTGRTTTDMSVEDPAEVDFPADGKWQQCQAACEADSKCGAWIFEPPGSYFIEEARCRVLPPTSEADASYTPAEDGWVSGIKPGVRILSRPYEPNPDQRDLH